MVRPTSSYTKSNLRPPDISAAASWIAECHQSKSKQQIKSDTVTINVYISGGKNKGVLSLNSEPSGWIESRGCFPPPSHIQLHEAKLLHLKGNNNLFEFFLGKGKWSNLWEQIPVDYADLVFKRSPTLHIHCFEAIARLEVHRQLIYISSEIFVMLLNLGERSCWFKGTIIRVCPSLPSTIWWLFM